MVAGGTAGSISWLSICPVEVVKNRIQTSTTQTGKNVLRMVRQIAQDEGIRSFYRGGFVLVLRGFPVNALIFVVYGNIMQALEKI